MARLQRSAVAFALALGALAPLVAAHASGAPTGDDLLSCKDVKAAGGWARIPGPDYTDAQGGTEIVDVAAPASLPKRLYITNGRAVKTSNDAGCDWKYIYPPRTNADPPEEVSSLVVTHLLAPTTLGLWIAGYEESGTVTRPRVAMTRNATFSAGNTTEEAIGYVDEGLPLVGRPVALAVPGQAPRAYLVIEEPNDTGSGDVTAPVRRLYGMTLARPGTGNPDVDEQLGQHTTPRPSWSRLTLPASLAQPDGVATSPRYPDLLWVWAGKSYGWSEDGGATWQDRSAPGAVTFLDVDSYGSAAVFSAAPGGGLMQRVDTRGEVLTTRPTPIAVRSAAHGNQAGNYGITSGKRTYGWDGFARRWEDVTPPGGPDLVEVTMGSAVPATGRGTGRILLGRTRDALYRFDLHLPESFVKPPPGPPVPPPGPGGEPGEPGITPARQVVTVAPGELADAETIYTVPPDPGRLDVFFLMDTTSSMINAIRGLQKGVRRIADGIMAQTQGEACFGLGEVKDFSKDPRSAVYGVNAVTAYRLKAKIPKENCTTEHLVGPLGELQAMGGDEVPEEAQTVALTQAITGEGSTHPPVAPGQDAGFLSTSTRVIVLITDSGFKMGRWNDGAYYPTMDETVDTLMNHSGKTHVVGIQLETHIDPGPAQADLSEVARRTEALAYGGVDCNSDGQSDLDTGDPLVCRLKNNEAADSIAPAIESLLLRVRENASLGVTAEDSHKVVAGVRRGDHLRVGVKTLGGQYNIRERNVLPFTPVVTCSAAQDGKDLLVRVVGRKRQVPAASAEILVRCRAPLVPPPPLPPPPEPPPIIERPRLLPVLIPPIQPPPIQNPPPNVNLNAGFSQQEEQQFQLAAVTQNETESAEEAEEVEFAMSALGPDDAAARVVLGAAAAMSMVAAGVLVRRRRTQRCVRPAHARRRL